ncbi:MAG: hypothetical protein QOI76_2209 [Frankiales bacterium]|nr:hypothetical protein [Frankiales bacterium]
MTADGPAGRPPVWGGYCADPFVFRDGDRYLMYGTTPEPLDGRAFQTLHSTDLVTWTPAGGALEPVPGAAPGTEYWAPEVVAADGTYWMYYSAGPGDAGHHLRVATATDPAGPFHDLGIDLTPELPFAIDPSPFRDDDGSWWLYFATDFLYGDRPGTVVAVAPLAAMTALGEHRIVLTATADWQRYQANRHMYGANYDWHTLEGPHVVRHDNRYWMFYSGGDWHSEGYGVAVAVAERPQGPWTPQWEGPTFLSTAASGLIGPGHNSAFVDHDGSCVVAFHSWNAERTIRRPHLAATCWTPDGPALLT